MRREYSQSPGGKAGWLFGTGSGTQVQPPSTALRIQTSILGRPRPVVHGRARLAGNLFDYVDFFAQPLSSGGKGLTGGGKGQTAGYNYSVVPIFGICEGPAEAVIGFYDQNATLHRPGGYGMTYKLGGYAQTAFGYMVSNHPDRALTYRGTLLGGAFPMNLATQDQLPNMSFIVQSLVRDAFPGSFDADVKDVIIDWLTNVHYGIDFPSAFVSTFSQLSDWCVATGMVISEAVTEQRALNTVFKDYATALDFEFVWSDGVLDAVPYGDVVVNGNGRIFTPDLATVFDFDDRHYMRNTGGVAQLSDPVIRTITRQSDALNLIQAEFYDRSNNYNPSPVSAPNSADISQYGLRSSGTQQWHFLVDKHAATTGAYLNLGRQKVRRTYQWTTKQNFIFINPMALVTLTDEKLGLDRIPVRIKSIQESQNDGSLTFTAEEFLLGTGTPYDYNSQSLCCGTNIVDRYADPGVTVAVFADAPLALEPNGPSLVIAAAGKGTARYARPGVKGIYSIWYHPDYFASNPTTAGSQDIYRSTPNDGVSSFTVKGVFHGGAANAQVGVEIVSQSHGGAPITITNLVDVGPQASLPAGGFGVMIAWDLTADPWLTAVRISGGTVQTTSTASGGQMDPAHPLFQSAVNPGSLYFQGQNAASGGQSWSQEWIGLDDDIDTLDPLLGDVTYLKFFKDTTTHANAPNPLSSDGSKPTGCPPTFYFAQAPGTGSSGAGNNRISTGCLAGTVFPTTLGGGSSTAVGAGTIPASGTYQAVGSRFSANYGWSGVEPFGGIASNWGKATLWVSTDAGLSYTEAAPIPGPSSIGKLSANFALHVDPDTVNTLSVDLTESLGSLAPYSAADADAGRSLSIVGSEFIDYSAAALTSAFNYNLTTYIRRGQLGSAPAAHVIGDTFAQFGLNSIFLKYPVSMIGTTVLFKITGSNTNGGGTQDLSEVDPFSVTLNGPPAPVSPVSLTVSELAAGTADRVVYGSWPVAVDPSGGITGYDFGYDTGGPDTIVATNMSGNTIAVPGLAPGSYTFKVRSHNSIGTPGTWTTAPLVVT